VQLGLIDIERGVKLAGSRSYFLTGMGTLLYLGVLRLAFDMMVERGFIPMTVPVLVRDDAMTGTGYFPIGREQAYAISNDHAPTFLVGTAEVSLTAYHMNETWMPSRASYGETHSASRFYEFQARRLNMKYRDEQGHMRLCYTLSNTVIASPRISSRFWRTTRKRMALSRFRMRCGPMSVGRSELKEQRRPKRGTEAMLASGGRTWWAHLEFTRINIRRTNGDPPARAPGARRQQLVVLSVAQPA